MTQELYKKYRPLRFSQMVGQNAALKPLIKMWKLNSLPHSILFTGPSGVGKTTGARILANKLGCSEADFTEINGAQVRGIDSVREITKTVKFSPMVGKSRVWILDEVHKITSDGADALLKVLEDTPKHAYFFLCTTDPQKLKRTLRTRCHLVELSSISDNDIKALVLDIGYGKEHREIPEEVVDKIAECSDGSARQALVFLHAVIGLDDIEEQLNAITKGSTKQAGIDIARALYKGVSWKQMGKILKESSDEDAEKVRWIVMGYANSILRNKADNKAAHILECFRENFFDTKHNGLTIACWEVLKG